jgi:hypothetical protein
MLTPSKKEYNTAQTIKTSIFDINDILDNAFSLKH